MDQLLAHLADSDEGGERDDHRADSRCREHPNDEVGAVRVEQSDTGALAGTEGNQSAGELCRAAIGLGVADAVTVANKKRVVCSCAGLVSQDRGDRGGITGHGRHG